MKKSIKQNLEKLFNQNMALIKGASFQVMLNALLENDPTAYNLNITSIEGFYGAWERAKMEELKDNKQLADLFDSAMNGIEADDSIVEGFKRDIIESFEVIKKQVIAENKGFKNQIIFLEHDYEPYACFCGFGEGRYPILGSPQYIKYNHKEELFNGVGKLDYSTYWKEIYEFNTHLEELELMDIVWYATIYQGLKNAYRYKTSLLLFEAFEQIPLEAFSGIPIQLPLLIYANEHDCEQMNVYAYE